MTSFLQERLTRISRDFDFDRGRHGCPDQKCRTHIPAESVSRVRSFRWIASSLNLLGRKEPLINPGRNELGENCSGNPFVCPPSMTAGSEILEFNANFAAKSLAIGKICNTEVGHLGLRSAGHVLIRGPLLLARFSSRRIPLRA